MTAAPARSRRRAATTLGALLALALVSTAHAPSIITIRPGDTLWELARAHGTSESAVRSLNGLSGNGTIYAGQQLRLPSGGSGTRGSSRGSSEVSHRVRSGETLSGIALRYGVSQSAIARRNSLSGGRLYAGTTIAVPRGSGGGTSSTSAARTRASGPVRGSVAENRRALAARSHPSRAQVRRMVASTARRHGVSPSLAVAVAFQESGFQQRVVSGANAIGVMQVLPSTGQVLSRQYGLSLNLLDTQDNVTAGVLLLRQLLRSEGTAEGALAGYYQGLGSIARQGLLPQTRSYIRNIQSLRGRFPSG
jgi:LysM repeat protein